MTTRLFTLTGDTHKRLAVTDGMLYLTDLEVDTFEAARDAAAVSDSTKSFTISVTDVTEVNFNTQDETVEVKYADAGGQARQEAITFKDDATAQEFGSYIGESLSTARIETEENKLVAALQLFAFLVVVLAVTYFLTTLVGEDIEGGTSRRRGKIAVLGWIVNLLGVTGLWIVGGLLAAFIAYAMYVQYTEPAMDVRYVRQ